jgi:hypothetical protein
MKHVLVLAALLLLAFPAGAALAADDPAIAAAGFYDVYQAQHKTGGGIPDATGRLRYSAVLSPNLNRLLNQAAAAQARTAARIKASGPKAAVMPMFPGDIFTSLFEGATDWQVGECKGDDTAARCPVALTHVDPPIKGKPAPKPANWRDVLVMAHTPAGWKVDDVIYDAGFAFGNTGRLTDMLKMVVASNP